MTALLPPYLQQDFWNKCDEFFFPHYLTSYGIFYKIFILIFFSYSQFLILNTLLSLCSDPNIDGGTIRIYFYGIKRHRDQYTKSG